jgi:hypothetical protein
MLRQFAGDRCGKKLTRTAATALQITRPLVPFVASGTIGDAQAPFVLNGKVRRPAPSLQGAPTSRIGKSAPHLIEGGSGVLSAKSGIGRVNSAHQRHNQQRRQEDRTSLTKAQRLIQLLLWSVA